MNGAPPSLAREFFEKLRTQSDRGAFLASMVNPNTPTFETEWLDFKSAAVLNDTDVTRIWSKALSSFSNTGGGVLIWGIDCRKVNGIDAAHTLSLVDKPQVLLSRLKELTVGATDPPVQGVEFEHCTAPNETTRGFVVGFIPEGDFKPYRAERCDKQYYIRAVDSSGVAPRPLLNAMFFPKPRCSFQLEVKCVVAKASLFRNVPIETGLFYLVYEVFIRNIGETSGADLFAVAQTNGEFEIQEQLWEKTASGYKGNAISAKRVIHPGEIVPMFHSQRGTFSVANGKRKNFNGVAKFQTRVQLYAKDQPALQAFLSIEEAEISNHVEEATHFAVMFNAVPAPTSNISPA